MGNSSRESTGWVPIRSHLRLVSGDKVVVEVTKDVSYAVWERLMHIHREGLRPLGVRRLMNLIALENRRGDFDV